MDGYLLDACYFLFEEYLQEKKLCRKSETVPENRLKFSLEEIYEAVSLERTLKYFE